MRAFSFTQLMRGTLVNFAATVALVLSPATASNAQVGACTFKSQPKVLLSEGQPDVAGSRLLQVWEEPNRRSLWSRADPAGDGYRNYLRRLAEKRAQTDAVALLRASPSYNNDLVVRYASRWIKPATCLEKLLIGQQHGRMDLLETTTEFVAVILRRSEADRLRVYFYTINRNGIGRMSPVTMPVEVDAAAGWRVELVIHNHSFYPSDPTLNGVLAPSLPDAHFQANFARSHGLREARITNGIETVRMAARTFALFQVPE